MSRPGVNIETSDAIGVGCVFSMVAIVVAACIGYPPTPAETSVGGVKLQSVPASVFDEVQSRAIGINEMLSEAHDILNRIERALP